MSETEYPGQEFYHAHNPRIRHAEERWAVSWAEWRNRLHVLWTKAVGRPGYDKREWQEFEKSIQRAIDQRLPSDDWRSGRKNSGFPYEPETP